MTEQPGLPNAERMKFFTDAVVAIAMTLLILPLLESVSEAVKEDLDTAEFLRDHGGQIFAFVLSFLIIARFWVSHERLFDPVEHWTGPLMVLNVLWMLSVVVLPVVTAMVGSLEADRLLLGLYIGTMLVSSLVLTAMSLVVLRNPVIWGEGARPDADFLAGALGGGRDAAGGAGPRARGARSGLPRAAGAVPQRPAPGVVEPALAAPGRGQRCSAWRPS